MRIDNVSYEICESLIQNWHALPDDKGDLQSFDRTPREMRAQMLVILGQETDAEPASDRQEAVHVAAIVQRNQHQRRIERHGHKSIRSHSMDSLAILRRDDGYAGGKSAQYVSKTL